MTYIQCCARCILHSTYFFNFVSISFSVGKDILIDKFSVADFCSIRYSSNKFGSTLIYRKNLACAVGFVRLGKCEAFTNTIKT